MIVRFHNTSISNAVDVCHRIRQRMMTHQIAGTYFKQLFCNSSEKSPKNCPSQPLS